MTEKPGSEMPAGVILFTALFLVLPIYLGMGWLIQKYTGPTPIISAEHLLKTFAACCAAGLGSAVFSGRKMPPGKTTSLLINMVLSETPAFIGLIYLYLTRDVKGFVLLLAIAAGAFTWHGIRNKA